jgi:hypothetical protein
MDQDLDLSVSVDPDVPHQMIEGAAVSLLIHVLFDGRVVGDKL